MGPTLRVAFSCSVNVFFTRISNGKRHRRSQNGTNYDRPEFRHGSLPLFIVLVQTVENSECLNEVIFSETRLITAAGSELTGSGTGPCLRPKPISVGLKKRNVRRFGDQLDQSFVTTRPREGEDDPRHIADQIKAAGHKLMVIAAVQDDEGAGEVANILSLASDGFAFRTDGSGASVSANIRTALCQGRRLKSV